MLKKIKTTLVAAALVAPGFTTTVNATVFTFDLFDSNAGGARPPNYGLRLDGLFTGDEDDIYTFSYGGIDNSTVSMVVDSNADTVRIFGDMVGANSSSADGEARDTDWTIDFTYTNMIIDDNDGSWEFDSGVSDGTGIIESEYGDIFYLVEFMGSDGFGPDNDGVDCRAGDGPWCGNGWVNHSSISYEDARSSDHLYSSDFLYNGTSVPEPSALALLSLGLVGLGLSRRRKV